MLSTLYNLQNPILVFFLVLSLGYLINNISVIFDALSSHLFTNVKIYIFGGGEETWSITTKELTLVWL
jgi:hypothetical protein